MIVLKFLTVFGSLVTTEELKNLFGYSVRIPSVVYNTKGLMYTLITFNFKNLNPWHCRKDL